MRCNVTALWVDKPKPPGDIGASAMRAPEISFGLNAARRLTFGPLGAWYSNTQLPFMGSCGMLTITSFPPL
jgi:hypothetical protein